MPKFSASLRSKLPRVGTTIFSKMSALAAEESALNLAQGFPDFDCSSQLKTHLTRAMERGANQYAPMAGLMTLREQISEKTEKLYTAKYKPETEITITAGATQAIFTAIAATVEEGDEVIIFTPAYDCYEPAIELMGGKTIFIKLATPEYRIDWQQVKKVINQRTKMIIINTPHNPTGSILSSHDLLQLEKILDNTNILVLSDEVYEHIIFDGYEHQSVARFPKLAERSFIISSFGKTYHTTGWKIGYCLAPSELMKEFRKAHQYNVFSVHTPSQVAYSEFLKLKDEYLTLRNFYQEKRDLFRQLISPSRFTLYHTAGSYFQLLGFEKISNQSDVDFAIELTKKNKLATIPISVFYNTQTDNKVLRFCFAKKPETLEKAAAIINSI